MFQRLTKWGPGARHGPKEEIEHAEIAPAFEEN